ncbi:MAG: PP2C family protein-serine/threonine phosphatase [Phycisphaerales bacterium]
MSRRKLRLTLIETSADPEAGDRGVALVSAALGCCGDESDRSCAIERHSLGTALLTDSEELGRLVVVVMAGADPDESRGGLFRLFDRLDDEAIPVMLFGDSASEGLRRMTPTGGVAMGLDEPAPVVGAALGALLSRQRKIESIKQELATARRFQGGLRNEIERMHEELQLAASVQREFLPRQIPLVDGLEFGVLYRPCGYVSGDIYDLQEIDEDHLGVFLADAAGHGVPAALMTMVMARSLVTKRVVGGRVEVLRPSEVLATLNREMVRRHGDAPRFATAVYVVVNRRTRVVRAACAGHPMPLLYTPDERLDVPAGGSLLGVFEQAEFDEAEVVLGERDLLVLHSDGFETAFPDGKASNYERRLPTMSYIDQFGAVAEALRSDTLEAGIGTLGEAIDAHSGSLHQVDDLTALFIAPRALAGTKSGDSRRAA